MCTIAIEALTPLYRHSIKLHKNIARSKLFCRIAKRSFCVLIQDESKTSFTRCGYNLKAVGNLSMTNSLEFADSKEIYLHLENDQLCVESVE